MFSRTGALLLLLLTATVAFTKEIEITVREPSGNSRRLWPVTTGIPFAKGALHQHEQTMLLAGKEIPLQTEVLARWPDGSVRWLLLDFQVTLRPKETRTLTLRYGKGVKRSTVSQPIRTKHAGNVAEIVTGPLRLRLSANDFRLLDAVWLDRNRDGKFSEAERLTTGTNAGIVLTTPDGEQFKADHSTAKIELEQAGPLRACMRIAGSHSSSKGKLFRYIVRLHAYRGSSNVKFSYTFINDHPQDLMTKIDSLELGFATTKQHSNVTTLNHASGKKGTLFQVDDQSFEVNGKQEGKRALGWAAVGGKSGGMALGLRNFWQNWPKSVSVDDQQIRVGICPDFPAGRYDGKPIKLESQLYYYLRDGVYSFKVGVSRTHELWAKFFAGAPDVSQLNNFYQAAELPLIAQPSSAYVSQTQAAGSFPPADPKQPYAAFDAWMNEHFQLHLVDLDRVREYGMLNFGDWYNTKWDSWGNLEYDTARCFFTQYLRTGDRRYFDRAAQAATHYLDVDVVHAVNPKLHEFPGSAKMRPGHVWLHQVGHTGGYYGRYDGTKYHDEAPLIMKGPYQVGMYNWGHQWIGGVFDYYFLTGDRRALEVATMTADTIAADCPTHYTDHIRDLGWPLNLVVAAYEATGNPKYLEAAKRQWKLMQKHFDPKKGFQVLLAYGHCNEPSVAGRCRGQNAYMFGLTLSGLARYHRITQDPEVLVGLTAGVDQLIRECWSEKHRSFYLSSCVHFRHNPPPALSSVTALASEALIYEAEVTGNDERKRIWRAAFETMVKAGLKSLRDGEQQGQTGYSSMMFHFTPHAFRQRKVIK